MSKRSRLRMVITSLITRSLWCTRGSTPEDYRVWVDTQIRIGFYLMVLRGMDSHQNPTTIEKDLSGILLDGPEVFGYPGTHADRVLRVLRDLGVSYQSNLHRDILVDVSDRIDAMVVIDRCLDVEVNVNIDLGPNGKARIQITEDTPTIREGVVYHPQIFRSE